MSDDTPDRPRTRRIEPGLTRRLSLGMGTLTLAGAAFFGVAGHAADRGAFDDSTSIADAASPDDR